jgi:hypothetical protein
VESESAIFDDAGRSKWSCVMRYITMRQFCRGRRSHDHAQGAPLRLQQQIESTNKKRELAAKSGPFFFVACLLQQRPPTKTQFIPRVRTLTTMHFANPSPIRRLTPDWRTTAFTYSFNTG